MAFDDNTLRDLATLALGRGTVDSSIIGAARLLLGRERAGQVLAAPGPDLSDFSLADALPFDGFNISTDLASAKAIPAGGIVDPLYYIGWRGMKWCGFDHFKAPDVIPASYQEPQISADAAILLAVAGSVIATTLASVRADVQHRIDEINFWTKQSINEAFVIIQSSVAAGAPVPLFLTRTIPAGGYALSGNVLTIPAAGTYGIRAWGSIKSSSTTNPLTMQIGLVVDSAETIVTAVRQSADPSVLVGWEIFFPTTADNTSIELVNASAVPVTIAGELSARRWS